MTIKEQVQDAFGGKKRFDDKVELFFDRVARLADKGIAAVAPRLALERGHARAQLNYASSYQGYAVPGSGPRSMRAIDVSSNSADADIMGKLQDIRALSKEMFMNSSLATTILRRHRILNVGSGLQVQSVPDARTLGIDTQVAADKGRQLEQWFDLWGESYCSDFEGINWFPENQGLVHLNMLMSGDLFFMPVWRPAPEKDFPFELTYKLIDADLVRDPYNKQGRDILGGVEKENGRISAIYVWNCYEGELVPGGSKCTRIPIYGADGYQQIHAVYDPERISQRRGLPLLANTAILMKQATRLSDAVVTSTLLSNYFTVFVRDASGMGLGPNLSQTENGYSPFGINKNPDSSIELGAGNIHTLKSGKDISIASPNKTDQHFAPFWDTMITQACAAGNIPVEQALMKYGTSYTAARAAGNDVWNYRLTARMLLNRRFNNVAFGGVASEAVMRGLIVLPGYFASYALRKAWLNSYWIGSGRGSINPQDEAKAMAIEVENRTSTREEYYSSTHGGRWDAMVARAVEEERILRENGLLADVDTAGAPDAAEESTQGDDMLPSGEGGLI